MGMNPILVAAPLRCPPPMLGDSGDSNLEAGDSDDSNPKAGDGGDSKPESW
jgi:hypothetical protein